MGRFVIKLKAIKYKMDIDCYLSSLPSGLAIKPSYKTPQFILPF